VQARLTALAGDDGDQPIADPVRFFTEVLEWPAEILAGSPDSLVGTLDTLRPPRRRNQPPWEWRKENPIRPIVFSDPGSLDATTVHLHLEHRFVQRLLARFKSQGFVHHDLARACIGVTDDPIARVILLGRLSLYGDRAARLHDEVLAVAARWVDVDIRKGSLKLYADATLEKTLDLLESTMSDGAQQQLPSEVRRRLAGGARQDLDDLRPLLKQQADERAALAIEQFGARGALTTRRTPMPSLASMSISESVLNRSRRPRKSDVSEDISAGRGDPNRLLLCHGPSVLLCAAGLSCAEASRRSEHGAPPHRGANQSAGPQVVIDGAGRRVCLLLSEHLAEDAQSQRISHFQFMERGKRQRSAVLQEEGLRLRGMRVNHVARHQETAVRVHRHPRQYASSPRSTSTRFGRTRSPTICFARASTSGQAT